MAVNSLEISALRLYTNFVAPYEGGWATLPPVTGDWRSDVAKAFPIGSQVPVIVLEIDPEGRRIRLSAKAVKDAEDAQEVREYSARGAAAAGFGASLADKLRGALNPREK